MEFPHLPVILTDSREIGEMAARHFLDRGFTNFAFCGYENMWWSQGRADAFDRTIESAGFAVHHYRQPKARSQRTWHKEQIHMANWLKSLPIPCGLMASTDDRAKHVIEASKIAGRSVPEDIAVLGVDNDDLVCDFSYPAISSVALDVEAAGYEAGGVLESLMQDKEAHAQKILIRPTHIVTRHSTDVLAIGDSDVTDSLRFIREHAKEPIQVRDVVAAGTISRRRLYQKFQNALGRSINQEIRRVRVEIIMELLIETDLSITEITRLLGFTGVDHISRYFKRETGVSPYDFRRNHLSREAMTS
jgi:LacI family transcriptional regulator